MIDKPCSAYVLERINLKHVRIYCEAGPDDHWGTHCGDKSEEQYKAELKEWEEANALGNQEIP